jgi:sulfatase maturation enzyme AslB (radical SAM superfamily)
MYQYAELVHWMKNKETIGIMPAQVDIDLTNICNQDCFYCNSAEHRAARPVQKKYTEYIELLDKLSTWRSHSPKSFGTLHTITYTGGGEPTLLNGYEKVLKHTIDLGFLTSITTNGSHLNDLLDNVSPEKIQRIAWIGIDIDAGSQEKYEQIRHSLTKHSLFSCVIENATKLVKIGGRVDFKALLTDLNSDESSLRDLFLISQQVGVRQLYLRPTVLNGRAYDFSSSIPLIDTLSKQYNIPVKFNLTKTLTRNYTRCHQMYRFPVFCADGEIYTCCDNKGNSKFSLGRWDQGDFRDLWLSDRHHSIYNSTDTRFCPHCRPNSHNIGIQNIINNDAELEQLYV